MNKTPFYHPSHSWFQGKNYENYAGKCQEIGLRNEKQLWTLWMWAFCVSLSLYVPRNTTIVYTKSFAFSDYLAFDFAIFIKPHIKVKKFTYFIQLIIYIARMRIAIE